MGIDRASLPDSLLRRVSPSDRQAAGLPCPVSALAAKAVAKAEHKREKALQDQIVNWLRLRGITVIRSRMDRKTTNNRGVADLLFAVRGQAVAVEVKLPGQKATADQEKFLAILSADGWKVAVVHSLDEARAVVEAVK